MTKKYNIFELLYKGMCNYNITPNKGKRGIDIMTDKQVKKDDEASFIYEKAGERKLYMDLFIKFLIQKCMGKALDEARISPMTDRQLTQFSRTIKDEFYKIADYAAKILVEHGYESSDSNK